MRICSARDEVSEGEKLYDAMVVDAKAEGYKIIHCCPYIQVNFIFGLGQGDKQSFRIRRKRYLLRP